MPNPAVVLYEAWRTEMNKTRDVFHLSWDLLSKEQHAAWWAVVRAAVETLGIGKGGGK